MIWWSGACRGAGWSLWRAAVGRRGRVESCTSLELPSMLFGCNTTSRLLPLGCLSWAGACKSPHIDPSPLLQRLSLLSARDPATPPCCDVSRHVCISSAVNVSSHPQSTATCRCCLGDYSSNLRGKFLIARNPIGRFARLPGAGAPEGTPERPARGRAG